MNKYIFIILCCILSITDVHAEVWESITDNKLVNISVEKALYKKSGDDYFYLRFKINNKGDEEVGVSIPDRRMSYHPNQLGESDLKYRTFISEKSSVPEAIDDAMKERINKSFKDKTLTNVNGHGELGYYVSFNNTEGINKIDLGTKKYILISIKGQLIFTNGVYVWDEKASSELCLEKPIEWRVINIDGIIIK